MTLLILSFFAGLITILAPCVLPILPIILGTSLGEKENKYKPYIIIGSLIVSIIIFSLLLKASTLLLGINPIVWRIISATILIVFGLITLFPYFWKKISIGFSNKSNILLGKSSTKGGIIGDILVGASLGPVFGSCSPTYILILAIILPISFIYGLINLLAYSFGLGIMLVLIAFMGQKFSEKIRWLSNPNGIFKKLLGILFILIGIAIISGYDKVIEAKIIQTGFLDTSRFEQNIIEKYKL